MNGIVADIIVSIILLVVVGGAVYYIYKEKKKGTKCIGCPMAGNCAKHRNGMGCDK